MGGWKQGGSEQGREQRFPIENKAHIENGGGGGGRCQGLTAAGKRALNKSLVCGPGMLTHQDSGGMKRGLYAAVNPPKPPTMLRMPRLF